MLKNKNAILLVSAAVLVAGTVYLLTRKKEDEAPSVAQAPPSAPEPEKKAAPKVIITKKGTNVYSLSSAGNINKIIRATSKDNETVGDFIGYRTIGGRVYVLFSDLYNSGNKSVVLKSFTNYGKL